MTGTLDDKMQAVPETAPVTVSAVGQNALTRLLFERLNHLSHPKNQPPGVDAQKLVGLATFSTYMDLRALGYSPEQLAGYVGARPNADTTDKP